MVEKSANVRARLAVFAVSATLVGATAAVAVGDIPEGLRTAQVANDVAAQGDNVRALTLYTEALQSGDLSYENQGLTHFNRGMSFLGLGNYQQAIDDYSVAMDHIPGHRQSYISRAIAREQTGDYRGVIADFSDVVQMGMENADLIFNRRGMAFADLGQFDRAVIDYSEAMRTNPDYTFAYRNRGRAYFQMGNFAAAAADFGRAHEISGDFAYAPLWRYISAARAGEAEAASRLRADMENFQRGMWPEPIARMFTGRNTPEAIYRVALNDNPDIQRGRLSEFFFFAAEHFLIAGDAEHAAELLFRSLAMEMSHYDEHKGAQAELARLGLPGTVR